jgi:hypothetical protein
MKKLIPYITSSWKRNIGCLLSPEEKHFNWFLFGKKYYDDKMKVMLLDIKKGMKLYEIKTGETWILEKSSVVVIHDKNKGLESVKENKNIVGIARSVTCEYCKCCDSCFCHEVEFYLPKYRLQKIKDVCDLILYSKRNYPLFSYINPDFPSPDDIDAELKRKPCNKVCKKLYEALTTCISKEYIKY